LLQLKQSHGVALSGTANGQPIVWKPLPSQAGSVTISGGVATFTRPGLYGLQAFSSTGVHLVGNDQLVQVSLDAAQTALDAAVLVGVAAIERLPIDNITFVTTDANNVEVHWRSLYTALNWGVVTSMGNFQGGQIDLGGGLWKMPFVGVTTGLLETVVVTANTDGTVAGLHSAQATYQA
jgi:hypothetical protein